MADKLTTSLPNPSTSIFSLDEHRCDTKHSRVVSVVFTIKYFCRFCSNKKMYLNALLVYIYNELNITAPQNFKVNV